MTSSEATLEKLLVPSKSVKQVQNEDGAALLDVAQGICFSLNPLGLRIWESLKLGRSAEEITVELRTQFDVSSEQLKLDVAAFLADLTSKNLLLPSAPEASWLSRTFPWAFRRTRTFGAQGKV